MICGPCVSSVNVSVRTAEPQPSAARTCTTQTPSATPSGSVNVPPFSSGWKSPGVAPAGYVRYSSSLESSVNTASWAS